MRTSPERSEARPVYLVRGEDPTLLADAVREVVATVLDADDASLAVEDLTVDPADDQRAAALLDACLTPPFLTASRVVIARNAGALSTEDGVRLATYLEHPLDTTVLILVGGGGTIPPKLAAAVKKAGQLIDANAPRQGRERTNWMEGKLEQAPLKLDAPARRRLADHLGEDVARLGGILEVLAGAYGEGARIGVQEIEPFLGGAGGVAPWELTDALDRGDCGRALASLHRLLDSGDRHPLAVMSTLHRHYGAMLRLDGSGVTGEAGAAALLGLKSNFPARKALAQVGKLGSTKVLRAVGLLAEADLDLRGAKAWPEALVMEVLVARLCQLARG